MNSIVSNIGQVQEIKASGVVGVFKAIAPRSFEKTFDGIPTNEIVGAMKICISGLTRQQIDLGLNMVRDNGFCPDPAMFRKWCLGIQGFGTEQQRLQDLFKGKYAALANIVAWVANRDKKITNAEREAYERSIDLFVALNHTNNHDRASFYAYEAFKENYLEEVREFVENGTEQAIWVKPPRIDRGFVVEDQGEPKEQTEEEKAKVQEMIKSLKSLIKRPVNSQGDVA